MDCMNKTFISKFVPFNTVDTGVMTGAVLSGGLGVELDCERFDGWNNTSCR